MIVLLARTTYNGDAIKKLSPDSKCGPKPISDLIDSLAQDLHEYYVFGFRGSMEIADYIRQYNLCNISIDIQGGIYTVISGCARDIVHLVYKLSQSDVDLERKLADYFISYFPDIFKNIPRATNGTLMIWKAR